MWSAASVSAAVVVCLLVACSPSSSGSGGDGGSSPFGPAPCPKLPNRDLANNPDGTVLCETRGSFSDGKMLMCKNGTWVTVLDCTESFQGGHPCECQDGATGDAAFCSYTSQCGDTRVTRGGGGIPDAGATDSGAAGCSTPNDLQCGTGSDGVEYGCPAGEVCCYTAGPGGSMTCGAKSACVAASAPNGSGDQCPAGQYQLCKTDAECGTGYRCSGPTNGYCM